MFRFRGFCSRLSLPTPVEMSLGWEGAGAALAAAAAARFFAADLFLDIAATVDLVSGNECLDELGAGTK